MRSLTDGGGISGCSRAEQGFSCKKVDEGRGSSSRAKIGSELSGSELVGRRDNRNLARGVFTSVEVDE